MGTSAIVRVFEVVDPVDEQKRAELCAIYVQSDGYPDAPHGVGFKLAKFCKARQIICGIGEGRTADNAANGAGCLAAQIVAHLKEGIGGIYLVQAGLVEQFHYTYHVVVPWIEPGRGKQFAKVVQVERG